MRPPSTSTRARNKEGTKKWLQFEGYERREAKILGVLKEYGISSPLMSAKTICHSRRASTPYKIVQETQPICFENAKWAYTVGCGDRY